MRRTLTGALLLGLLLCTPLAMGREKNNWRNRSDWDRGDRWDRQDINDRCDTRIRDDWRDDRFRRSRQGLPPGLAKRDRLPPGLQRQVRRRGALPPGLQNRVYRVYRDDSWWSRDDRGNWRRVSWLR